MSLIEGSAFHIPLADRSVHTIITSPPYWGLRKYAGEQTITTGGDPDCDHGIESITWRRRRFRCLPPDSGDAFGEAGESNADRLREGRWRSEGICVHCGAYQAPLGLEATPERHIQRTVEWAREVWRVLRDDGVFWLNYGDCYHGSGGENNNGGLRSTLTGNPRPLTEDGSRSGLWRRNPRRNKGNVSDHAVSREVRAGNLALMPHRVALALQADGWIVRQDLVWAKPNPMPESIRGWTWQRHRLKTGRSKHAVEHNIKGGTAAMLRDASIHRGINPDWVPDYVDCPGCDKCTPNDGLILQHGSWRHTRSHEYVFMLTKQMQYWSDQEAVREPQSPLTLEVGSHYRDPVRRHKKNPKAIQGGMYAMDRVFDVGGRNPRSVLNIPTAPYRGAHYATFPPALVAPLILATCPRWCCPVCGQGWAAVVERVQGEPQHVPGGEREKLHTAQENHGTTSFVNTGGGMMSNILGHRPTCDHPHTQAEATPGIVADPFVGSGTAVMVARQLLRRGIGIDLSRPYLRDQAQNRITIKQPTLLL